MLRRVLPGLIIAAGFMMVGAMASFLVLPGRAVSAAAQGKCQGLPGDAALNGYLTAAPAAGGDAGGLFHGERNVGRGREP
jgi:hypothetical protein